MVAEIGIASGKSTSILGVSTPRAKYRQRGASRGPTGQPGGCPTWPRVGPCQGPFWSPCGAPLRWIGDSGSFRVADFLYNFYGMFGALLMAGKPEVQKQ